MHWALHGHTAAEIIALRVNALLMCMTDMKGNVALLGHTALMNESDKYIVNQRVGLLRANNSLGIYFPYLYILTNSVDFIENLRGRANSGVQVNLSTSEIKASKLIIAPIEVNTEIAVFSTGNDDDYISLTDIAKYKSDEPNDVIRNWLRNRDTIDFLGLWEQITNPNFKPIEFDGFKNEAGKNSFVLSPQKWITATNAIGITSKSGRYGGTYAHKDIAFEFASWISPEFKLYIIKDYQRLKTDENSRLSLEWNVNRVLAKLNYKIHTDAIKENLISNHLTQKQIGFTYANEADILNVALFGKQAKEWRNENPDLKGNIRDYASIEQLIVMVNLENINAHLIEQGMEQRKRLLELNKIARSQLQVLLKNSTVKKLESLKPDNKMLTGGDVYEE